MLTNNPASQRIDPSDFLSASLGIIQSYASSLNTVANPVMGLLLGEFIRIQLASEPSWELNSIQAWSWRLAGAGLGWAYDNHKMIYKVSQSNINHCAEWMRSYCAPENPNQYNRPPTNTV